MEIALDHEKLVYCGRIDQRNPKKPEWVFPATSLQFCFWGHEAKIVVTNRHKYWDNRVGAIVDGVQKQWLLNETGETEITLVKEERNRRHKILFFKRMDSCHELVLEHLFLAEGSQLLDPLPVPQRRIEVYGDSVSAGEVSEALDYVGKVDPEHNGEYSNSWYSYAWMTARKLNAQLHDIAQGGIPLMHGTGWVEDPIFIGMEEVWDKVHYYPNLATPTTWDFSKYTPHVIIVAIGQNDSHPEDFMKQDPDGEMANKWKAHYYKLIQQIREKYPKAVIILTTTILEHDKSWDDAIEEVCERLNDSRIRHFLYTRNGNGTSGHIRIPEADEMSDELVEFIQNLNIPVWED